MKRVNPPFRADQVGSLLRPAPLKEARAKRERGEIGAAEFKTIEDHEIAKLIAKQEEIGLWAITDGENRRAWWNLDFLERLDGAEGFERESGAQFHGVTTKPRGVRTVGKLGFSGHPMIEHFKFVQAHTSRTAKMTIPSPTAMHWREGRAGIDQKVYPDLDFFFRDLGDTYRKVIAAFAAAGCRYLQLDDVYLAHLCDPEQLRWLEARGDDPKQIPGLYADLINRALEDRPAGMTVTMHLCHGNFRSTFVGSGGYEPIADLLFNRINIDGYFLEYDSERSGGFEPLRFLPKGKTAVLGLVTTKTGPLESKDAIKRRIDAAAKFTDLDQLCLSPQCGFASTEEGNILSEDEQWAKLRRVVEIADEVWG